VASTAASRLRVEEDAYVPQRSVQALKKLIDVDKVFAVLGTSGSSHLLAMMPTIEENQIPALNFAAVAGAHFTPPRKTVFNIGATYCQEIDGVMKHLITSRKLQGAKFAIIYQDDDYGADVKCGYDAALKALGLSSTVAVAYKRGAKDLSAEVLAPVPPSLTGGIITRRDHAQESRRTACVVWRPSSHIGSVSLWRCARRGYGRPCRHRDTRPRASADNALAADT
jgi:hypothetical protein